MAQDDHDPRDAYLSGEVLSPDQPDRPASLPSLGGDDVSLAADLTRAEVDQQVSTAKRYPRAVSTVQKNIETMATLDMQTATECIYVLPRDGKKITGPSVRFAEIVAQAWGNCRIATRVTSIGKTHLEATGIFHDLETNIAIAKSVSVRITTKNGRRYGDDMIGVAAAAGTAKALRNAVLAVVPKGVWRKGLDKAQAVMAGTTETLAARRHQMVVKMGEEFGAKPAEIFQVLGVADLADVTLGHMIQLAGVYTSVATGEARWEDIVAQSAPEASAPPANKTLAGANGQKPAAEKAQPKASAPKAEPKAEPKPKADPKPQEAEKPQESHQEAQEGSGATAGPAEAETQPDGQETGAETESEAQNDDDGDNGYVFEGDKGVETQDDDDQIPAEWSAFVTGLGTAADWPGIRGAVFALVKTPYFDSIEAADQAGAFRMAWNAMVQLNARTDAPIPDPAKMADAFRVWLEHETNPETIEATWTKLASSAAYGKIPQGGRDDLIKAKKARKDALREGN